MSGKNALFGDIGRVERPRVTPRAVETDRDLKSFQEACHRIVGAASDAIFRPSVVKSSPTQKERKISPLWRLSE
jgi:hypothetical protein